MTKPIVSVVTNNPGPPLLPVLPTIMILLKSTQTLLACTYTSLNLI